MDFETLKEQLMEQLRTLRNKIQESELFIRLKERYDNLPPQGQQAILWGGIVLALYIAYSFPAGFVSAAHEKIGYFDENRQLIRELIRAGRIARTVQLPPPAPPIDMLRTQVEDRLLIEKVMPEQKLGLNPTNDVADKSLVPKDIEQSGLKTTVKQLNLKQVVRIGESLNSIDSTQLINIAMVADSKDPHYFNVDYEIAAFSVPQAPTIEDPKNSKLKSRSRKNRDSE